MDLLLNEDQQELWDLVGRVGAEKFRPAAFDRRFSDWAPPVENLKLLGELGILGICMPEEFGGGGRPVVDGMLVIEQISKACPITGSYALMAITGPASFIAKWGTPHLKEKYIAPTLAGEIYPSISLTEPQAGSDLTTLRTSAEIKGDKCIINGGKIFCSRANYSDYFLVYVRFGPGSKGIGAVIMDKDAPGFTIGKPRKHFSDQTWCELSFDNAEVPVENILFDGGAFSKLMASYSVERCGAAVYTLGIAGLAMELALEYAEERKQFNRPISEFQMTQARLADMYMRLEAGRLLTYKSAINSELGAATSLIDSSVAKVAGIEAASYVCEQAMNVFGGSGMSTDLPLEWLYRCARSFWPAGGTHDIHRSMIAAALLNRRFNHRADS